MEHGSVHDVAPGNALLSILCEGQSAAEQGPSPQSLTRWLLICQVDISIPVWDECLEQQSVWQWSSALPDRMI